MPIPDDAVLRLSLRLRVAALVSALVLVSLGISYYLTYEPAPRIRIQWAEGVGRDRQEGLERRFRLINKVELQDRFAYDLVDTSRANLRAILEEPSVHDTDDIDRATATIPFTAPYGDSWIWVAYRLPVLRIPWVVEGLVVLCVAVVAGTIGAWLQSRRVRRLSIPSVSSE